MCGLAGMMGKGMISVDFDTFRDILYMSAMRGPHSTGLMSANLTTDFSAKHPRIVKRVGPSHYFIMMDQQDKQPQLKSYMTDVFLGHCRYSTVGATNEKNAHPFDVGDLVGAHNGTLYDHWSYGTSNQTDSELMFKEIQKRGVMDVFETMKDTSAYAVSIYDKNTRKVTLARNKLRPLYVGVSNKRSVLYWASEYGILYAAASRNNVDMKIFHLEKDKVYTVDIDKIKPENYAPWTVQEVVHREPKLPKWAQDFNKNGKNSVPFDVAKDKSGRESFTMDWGDWGEDSLDSSLAIQPTDEQRKNTARVTFDLDKINNEFPNALDDIDKLDEALGLENNPKNGSDYVGLKSAAESAKIFKNEELIPEEDLDKASIAAGYGPITDKERFKDFVEKVVDANTCAVRPKLKSVPRVTPKAKYNNRKGKRGSVLATVDELLSPRKEMQSIDDLMDQVKAEKAIEEAQGVTRQKPRESSDYRLAMLKQNYGKDGEIEECMVCQKKLSWDDVQEASAVEVYDHWYFSCKSCDEEIEAAREEKRARQEARG